MTAPTMMKALVFDGRIHLTDVPVPVPKDGEALIKVSISGICKTDVEITKGYMRFSGIPGHEFVGTVLDSPYPHQIGTRVVGEINAGCGVCRSCRVGMERHCSRRTVLGIAGRNGAFAEYLTLPASNLVEVPAELPDRKAIFTEPAAAALEILEQVCIQPAHSVLVIGDGKLGLLVCLVLRLTGCDLTLAGKHREKMEIFTRLGGKAMTLDELEKVEQPFDFVVEVSGDPSGFALAMQHIRPRGTIVLKSTYHGELTLDAAPIVVNEVSIVGSRCGVFKPALRLMEAGLLDPLPLLHAVFPFEKAEEAFVRSQEPGVFKVALEF